MKWRSAWILGVLGAVALAGQVGHGEEPISFPKDFWWGASLAAHQAEGGNHNQWTRWEEVPGHIRNGDKSGDADKHWELYEKDFDNLVWLGANTFRMSIEWSRLQPAPGTWNEDAAWHYRKMIEALIARNIRPVLCLFHFTLPIWFEDAGGFENPDNTKFFLEFVSRSERAFGDLVGDWLTMNEPIVYALAAYGAGVTPPGVKDFSRTFNVVVNLMKAHGEAYHLIHVQNPKSKVSFAHHMRIFSPLRWFSPMDQYGAHVADQIFNWSFFDAIQTGKIEIHAPKIFSHSEECPQCLDAIDFIGINYYTRDYISLDLNSDQKFIINPPPKGTLVTDLGWEIYPEGIATILKGFRDRGFEKYPIIMTENGLADAKDQWRAPFIHDHLKVFLKAAEEYKLNAAGYLHWSIIDNFEWVEGFEPRFGLFEVDYKTMERKARPSASYFREMGIRKSLLPAP